MKLSVITLVMSIVVVAHSVSAFPEIVKDGDLQPRASTVQKPDGKTLVNYTHFVKPSVIKKDPHQNGVAGVTSHGIISPFGTYGGDCTLSWIDGKSLGGGFNSGVSSPDDKNQQVMGLGGGFNYNPDLIDVGAGISAFGQNANYHLSITKDGKITLSFDSSKTLKCVQDPQKPMGQICTA